MENIYNISNFKEIFEYDLTSPSSPNAFEKDLGENNENLMEIQETRKNFFMQAFEIYLEKTMSKNQEKNQNYSKKASSKIKIFDEVKMMNLPENMKKVQKLLNTRKNKNKLQITTKIDKFEKKMEIFKNLNSFIDIKSFLFESNIMNYNNSEELLLKMKSHYKESLNSVLSAQKTNNIFSLSPQKNLDEIQTKVNKMQKINFEMKMNKFRKIIDRSKKILAKSQLKNCEKSEFKDKISDVLHSHLLQTFDDRKEEKIQKEIYEDANQDILFERNLKKIENRFISEKNFFLNGNKDPKTLSSKYSEDQLKRNEEEMDKLNKVIKKIMLKGVLTEKGERTSEDLYLDEYKNQYKRIKTVLHKVTKNIFRKNLDKNNKSSSHKNLDISIGKAPDSNLTDLKLKSPFITEFNNQTDESSGLKNIFKTEIGINKRRESSYFIKKNIKEMAEGKSSSSAQRSNIKTTRNSTLQETINEENSGKIKLKLSLPRIINHVIEKQINEDPYLLNSNKTPRIRMRSESIDKSYKKENRLIHKKFENFLKTVTKTETSQKFLTEDLMDDMGEINKEINKLNYEKEDLSSLREIDPKGFNRNKNLNGNTYHKVLKKIGYLKL